MQANETIMRLIDEIRSLKLDKKIAEKALEERENRLKELLGDNETAQYKGVDVVTYKTYTRTGIDSSRLQAEIPEIYQQYKTESAYRRLIIK